jgi:Crinkler effector protein N-terminal domain
VRKWTKRETSAESEDLKASTSLVVSAIPPSLTTMANNDEDPVSNEGTLFELSCLVEGDRSVFFVTISRKRRVADLKEVIHGKRQRGLLSKVDAADLVLLKVSSSKRPETTIVAHFYVLLQVNKVIKGLDKDTLRGLPFNVDDPGVHELEALQLISECWTEQPANDKLSISVKLPATGEWLFALAYGQWGRYRISISQTCYFLIHSDTMSVISSPSGLSQRQL